MKRRGIWIWWRQDYYKFDKKNCARTTIRQIVKLSYLLQDIFLTEDSVLILRFIRPDFLGKNNNRTQISPLGLLKPSLSLKCDSTLRPIPKLF